MANSSSLFQVLDSFSRKNDVAAFTQDLTTAIKDGDKLAAMKALTDLANIFSGIAEATTLSNQELARLGIDGNSTWVKIGNNYINPSAKFASVSLSIIEIVNDMAQNQPVKLGPVLGLIDDGTDALSAVSLRVGYVPLALGLKAVSITAGGLSVLFGESNLFQTHIPTVQQNLAAGKSPSGGVFGQVTDMGGKYAIYATKNADGTMNELLIPMQGSTITDNRMTSGSPTKYTYTTNGIPNQIEYEGSVVSFNPITGALIGSARTYSDSSYELLTGILSTTDFLSSSVDSDSNVFSKNTSKDKFGTIAGIRQAVGAISANERWGGQTFATASTNLGSYLGNLNYVDPSTIYQNTLVNSFSFNTNFGGYIPPIEYSGVYIGIITPYPIITPLPFIKPVVLDLNQNGVELISLDESRALFDMSGTGFRQRTAWVAPSDALLAIDYNDDGVIKERKEINFVDWTSNPNLTDMEALALAFDTNKDGRLDSSDADFSKFRVWQDKNADGVSDAGELLTLTQAGMKSIDLKTTKMNWSSGANSISGLGSYTKLDGSQGLLSDSAFGHESAGWKAETVNGIQRVISERGDKYAVAGPTGNLVVNLNNDGLNGAIGGSGSDSMTTSGATPVFMQGNAGNDSLVGGDGDDWLEGGSGSDSISGGSGDDTIIVDSEDNLASISGGAGFDIIAFEGNTTFNIQLNLTNGFESAIGGAGNDNISVQTFYQIPRYWVRGSNPAFNVQLGWADIPIISSYVIAGGNGNDVLTAGYGNDILDGGKGNDILYGDWGNDTYLFGFGGGKDVISEVYAKELTIGAQKYMNTGIFPTLYSGPNGPGVKDDNYSWTETFGPENSGLSDDSRNSDTIRMGSGITITDVIIEKTTTEFLIGLKQDKSITSVTQLDDFITIKNWQYLRYKIETIEFADGIKLLLDNWLQGTLGANVNDALTGTASDNVLNGLSGADSMSGGGGNDIYVVDNINDVVNEAVNQGVDTVETSVTLNAELYANVENLTLVGTDHLNVIGNSLSNIIRGNTGNNILNGGGGVDTLVGGDGNDTYIVDTTTDTITETETGGMDTVQSSVTYTLGANVESLILTGVSAIDGTGNTLNNVITGNSAANTLNGGAGVDALIGGDGNDIYIVDTTTDSIIETATGGIDTVQSSVTYTLGATSHLENLTLTGTAAINGTGNDFNNVLIGNSGNNILNGGAGSDNLIGSFGNDIYVVAQFETETIDGYTPSMDVIVETDTTAGNMDTIEVGFENLLSGETYSRGYYDYSFYLTVNRKLTVDGHDDLEVMASAGQLSDSPISSSDYFGSFLIQDQFKGSPKVEQIKFTKTGEVMSMNDYLAKVGYDFYGTDGNDTMYGSTSVKRMFGGLGGDNLVGNQESNRLYGGEGDDRLSGGAGNDYLYGGDGSDTYVLSRGDGVDVAEDEYYSGGGGSFESQTIIVNANSYEVNLVRTLSGRGRYTTVPATSDLVVEFKNNTTDRLTFRKWWSTDSSNSNRRIVFNDKSINLDEIELALTVMPTTSGADITYGSGRNDTISGANGDDFLMGLSGADELYGEGGNDMLYGGSGNDKLYGSAGYDQLYGEDGNDSLYGGDGNDTLDGGVGADHLDGGAGWNYYYVDNIGDVVVGSGVIYSDLQTFNLADGQTNNVNINLGANAIGNDELNIIVGNTSSNFIVGNGGNDNLSSGGAGYDILQGGEGDDSLDRDVNGWYISGLLGNALLDGGAGNDYLSSRYTGQTTLVGNDFLIGGKGDDIIYASRDQDGIPGEDSELPSYAGMTGNDVILFNVGDGQDTLYAGEGPKLTLSLGKLTSYDQLSLTKSGSDLVLNVGASDKMTFADWYANNSLVNTRSIANLQVIAESIQGFSQDSTNKLHDNKIETFNFANVVAAFDAAGAQANWQLTEDRLATHMKSGSNDQAIGGDIAYQYGHYGNLTNMGLNATQVVLNDTNFGKVAQTFSTSTIGANEAITLS